MKHRYSFARCFRLGVGLLFLLLLNAPGAWAQLAKIYYTQGSSTATLDAAKTVNPDGSGGATLASAASFSQPTDIVLDKANGFIYVADQYVGTGAILRFTTAGTGRTVIVPATAGATYNGLALDAANNRLFFTQGSATNSALDALKVVNLSNSVVTTLASGAANFSQPTDLALDAANGLLYVTDQFIGTGAILRFTTAGASRTVIVPATATAEYNGLALDVAGNRLFFSQGSAVPALDALKVVSLSTGFVVTSLASGAASFTQPTDLAYDAIGGQVYVTDQFVGTGAILRFTAAGAGRTVIVPATAGATYNGLILDANSAPIVTTSGGTTAFVEGNNVTSTPVAIDAALTVIDDNATLASATVSITGNYQGAEDVLAFTNVAMGNIAIATNTGGVLTLTSAGATATVAQWQAALRAVTYTNSSNTPNTTTRTVSFAVNDGALASNVATKNVSVTATNDAPIVTTSGGNTAFTQSLPGPSTPVAIDAAVTVSDLDNTTLASATVSITTNYQSAEDVLAFTNVAMGNIAVSSNTGGVLTLTSAGATATVAQWQAALRAVTYNNTASAPNISNRTISFVANDGTTASGVATKTVTLTRATVTVASVAVPANGTYITGQNLNFTVTFTAAVNVIGSPTLPLTLDTGGSVAAAYVSGSGTTALIFRYTVVSGNLDATGITLGTALALNGGTIRDAAAQDAALTLNGVGSTAGVLVDGVAPTLTSINRQTPAAALTNATTLVYRVTFSEAVNGVGPTDFALTGSGTATGSVSFTTLVSSSVYDVTVTPASGNGTLRLDLNSSGTGITDVPGNAIVGGFTTGQTYTLDTTGPTVAITSTASNPTSTSPIPVTVTFSESVTGFVVGDIAVTNGTLSGFTAVSGTIYTFNITPAGLGLVTVDVAANVAQDAATNGNTAAPQFTRTYALALAVTAVSPVRSEKSAPRTSNVVVTFNQSLTNNTATQGALKVYSAQRGGQLNRVGSGTATVSGSTLTLDPTTDVRAREGLLATVTTAATSAAGNLATPQVVQFTAAVGGTGRGNFQPGSDPGVGAAPANAKVGDVDGDGDLDLLVGNYGSGTVSVRLNNGSGVFSGSQTVAVGSNPGEVVLGDVDGDGDLDLLTANVLGGTSTVSVRLNNGTGTFTGTQEVGVGSSAYSAALGDVDGDGDLDLLAANYGSGTVSVRLNDGAGNFSGTQNVAAGANAYNIALGDVDGDGDLDFVVSNYSNSQANVRLNDGTGIFSGTQTITVGSDPINVALGDIDGDGDLDFLTANNSSSTVSVRLNNGAGIFSGSQDLTVSASPYGVTLGDVDADGDLDFLVSSHGTDNVMLWLNNGTGTFTNTRTVPVGDGPYNVAMGDLDADGDLDFVTPNQNTTTASVRLNQAGPTIISFTPPSGPVGTVVTITGTLFTGATAVAFNGTAASSFTVNSATSITATVAAGTATGLVTVTTSGGTATSATVFTITLPATAAPVVINPANGLTLPTATPTYSGTASANSTVAVYVDGGLLSGTVTADGSGNWTKTQPAALAQGSHTVYATAQSSGSTVSANSNTNTFTVDTVAPTVAITSTASNPTSTSPIPVTVTFSENVTGFVLGDVTVSNGTPSGFTAVSGTVYTFNITPAGTGLVTVNVAANVAQDAATNGNTAAPQFSIQYNAPIVVAVWNGSVSTDWFTAANWTGGVPTATLDATIPAGAPRYPLLTTGTAIAKALTLAAGGSLAQTGGTLDLQANLTNNGSISATGGTVVMGTTFQNSGPNILGSSPVRFWNLTVNSNGVLLSTSAGASVQRLLTLNGAFVTQGNTFTLESNAAGTALVVNNSGGFVFGSATVQRYIDPSLNPGPGYRHYSSPVGSSTVADLTTAGFVPVLNPAYNSSATPGLVTPFPTVFGYDQSRLTLTNNMSAFDKGFVSPTSTASPLTVGQGYTVNIGASQLVDFVGPLNNGDLTLPLARNAGATAADAGWQLLGNPYPAPLDYSLVAAADRPNLDAAIYVYSSTSQYGGQYRGYVNGVGNPVVPVAQGFFTRVSPGQTSGALTLRNSQRLTTPDATTFQRSTAETRPLLQLTLRGAAGTTASDEAYVYFQAGATAGIDPQFDAVKLPNSTGLNLASMAVGTQLAINGLPVGSTTTVTVPLFIGLPATGTYTLNAAQVLNFTIGAQPFLHDLLLNTLTDLSQQPSYTFTQNAFSTAPRFEVVFGPQQVLGTASAALAAQVAVFPNPAHGTVAVELPAALRQQAVTAALVDALGRVVLTQTLPAGQSTHLLPLANVAAGVYSLRLQTAAGVVVKKLVVE